MAREARAVLAAGCWLLALSRVGGGDFARIADEHRVRISNLNIGTSIAGGARNRGSIALLRPMKGCLPDAIT